MTTANHEGPSGALEGVRVLDVAEPLGAFVSRLLGDLGADVIKIEPPGGDAGRHLSPFLTTGQERLSLPFVHANVNKRSVILDLEQRQDQEHFRPWPRRPMSWSVPKGWPPGRLVVSI